jgi:hypothetical protein
MDQLERYKQLIRTILEEHQALSTQDSIQPITIHFVLDDVHSEYLMVAVGWNTVWKKRVYATLFHGWVQDGKVWIEHDNVSPSVVGELVKRGVPETDILSAEEQPFVRITASIPLPV